MANSPTDSSLVGLVLVNIHSRSSSVVRLSGRPTATRAPGCILSITVLHIGI